MVDPIVVEEIESDDEWITKIEDPVLPANPNWLEEEVEELMFNVEAVRNVPIGTYQNSLQNRELIPPREPTAPPRDPTPPPREPTPSLDEPIVFYKRKHSEQASSSKHKSIF